MAQATFVKKSRRAYKDDGIKKGESYYWWKFRFGGIHRSKTAPRQSQLTQSEFYGTLLAAQETLEDMKPDGFDSIADFMGEVENIKSDLENLRDETQGKFDNIPEGLQQGDTGQMLENRVSELESLIGEFDGIDDSEPDEDDAKDKSEEGESAVSERIQALIDEISGFNWSID